MTFANSSGHNQMGYKFPSLASENVECILMSYKFPS